MERRTETPETEQLVLFDIQPFVVRGLYRAIDNIRYVRFGEAEHDPFIDDLNGLPNNDDIA